MEIVTDLIFSKEVSSVYSAAVISVIFFVFIFILSFTVEYIWNEYRVNAYNRAHNIDIEYNPDEISDEE